MKLGRFSAKNAIRMRKIRKHSARRNAHSNTIETMASQNPTSETSASQNTDNMDESQPLSDLDLDYYSQMKLYLNVQNVDISDPNIQMSGANECSACSV